MPKSLGKKLTFRIQGLEIGIDIFGKRSEFLGDASSNDGQSLPPICRYSLPINQPLFNPITNRKYHQNKSNYQSKQTEKIGISLISKKKKILNQVLFRLNSEYFPNSACLIRKRMRCPYLRDEKT